MIAWQIGRLDIPQQILQREKDQPVGCTGQIGLDGPTESVMVRIASTDRIRRSSSASIGRRRANDRGRRLHFTTITGSIISRHRSCESSKDSAAPAQAFLPARPRRQESWIDWDRLPGGAGPLHRHRR